MKKASTPIMPRFDMKGPGAGICYGTSGCIAGIIAKSTPEKSV